MPGVIWEITIFRGVRTRVLMQSGSFGWRGLGILSNSSQLDWVMWFLTCQSAMDWCKVRCFNGCWLAKNWCYACIISNYSLYDITTGSFSPTITRESKENFWIEIAKALRGEHPNCPEKIVDHIKKKWNNFLTTAKIALWNYNYGLTERGSLVWSLVNVWQISTTGLFYVGRRWAKWWWSKANIREIFESLG